MEQKKLWSPSSQFIHNSNLFQFETWISKKYDTEFKKYSELWEWSVENFEKFWASILEYYEVNYTGDYSQVVIGEKCPGLSGLKGYH